MHMGVYLKARYWANSDEAACGNNEPIDTTTERCVRAPEMWAVFLGVILLGGAFVMVPQIRAYCKGEIPKDMFSKRFACDDPSAGPSTAAPLGAAEARCVAPPHTHTHTTSPHPHLHTPLPTFRRMRAG